MRSHRRRRLVSYNGMKSLQELMPPVTRLERSPKSSVAERCPSRPQIELASLFDRKSSTSKPISTTSGMQLLYGSQITILARKLPACWMASTRRQS